MKHFPYLFALALTSTFATSCTDMREWNEQIEECEAELIRSLKSPSSYKVIDSRAFVNKMPLEEAATMFGMAGNAFFTDESNNTQIMWISIEYDADNSFGAAIRGNQFCNYALVSGDRWVPVTADYSQEIDQLVDDAANGASTVE